MPHSQRCKIFISTYYIEEDIQIPVLTPNLLVLSQTRQYLTKILQKLKIKNYLRDKFIYKDAQKRHESDVEMNILQRYARGTISEKQKSFGQEEISVKLHA